MADSSENKTTIYMKCEETTNTIADSSSSGKFECSLCKLKFSQEKYLTNHFKLCIVNTLDVDIITIKKERKTKDEMHSMKLLDEQPKTEPTFDIKLEDIEITETTISGTACPQSEQPPERLKTETPEDLFTLTKVDYIPVPLEDCMKLAKLRKVYRCTICDYIADYPCTLKLHMRNHSGEKPFKCTMCDYATMSNSYLTSHLKLHTGENTFKCTTCGYASASSYSLTVHIRKHTGEKPFKCTMCEYASRQRNGLTRHMRIHTGEKPFKCTLCEYACARRSCFKVHMKKHRILI